MFVIKLKDNCFHDLSFIYDFISYIVFSYLRLIFQLKNYISLLNNWLDINKRKSAKINLDSYWTNIEILYTIIYLNILLLDKIIEKLGNNNLCSYRSNMKQIDGISCNLYINTKKLNIFICDWVQYLKCLHYVQLYFNTKYVYFYKKNKYFCINV